MSLGRPWFAAKTFGIGSGMPLRWEGWAVLAVFTALLVADVRFAPAVWRPVGALVLVVLFGLVCALKTQGGWRWRWGG
jgi:hypothetical protein